MNITKLLLKLNEIETLMDYNLKEAKQKIKDLITELIKEHL